MRIKNEKKKKICYIVVAEHVHEGKVQLWQVWHGNKGPR